MLKSSYDLASTKSQIDLKFKYIKCAKDKPLW